MIALIKKSIIFFLILVVGCTTEFFNIIPVVDYKNLESTVFYNYTFYKSRDDIDKEFVEIAIL